MNNSESKSVVSRPIIVYCPKLSKELSNNGLPATSIGVRRIRPSSKLTQAAFRQEKKSQYNQSSLALQDTNINANENYNTSTVVFKIKNPDGSERRMNNQEKKALKLKLRQERYLQKKMQKQKLNQNQQSQIPTKSSSTSQTTSTKNIDTSTSVHCRYFQLPLHTESIRNEIAELKGDKSIPPLILSPAMATRASILSILPLSTTLPRLPILETNSTTTNDNLASKWATLLKSQLRHAEQIRNQDSLRPMAYEIVPEIWTRLRPTSISKHIESLQTSILYNSHDKESQTKNKEDFKRTVQNKTQNKSWDYIPRHSHPSSSPFLPTRAELDKTLVFQQLHQMSDNNIHISCGSKFGSDFLLYNGNREEQHAFAGLRVISSNENNNNNNNDDDDDDDDDDDAKKESYSKIQGNEILQKLKIGLEDLNHEKDPKRTKDEQSSIHPYHECVFPIPSAYDLAGYVRGLNTAGKLALLATVIPITSTSPNTNNISKNDNDDDKEDTKENVDYHVVFVDLALEKILSAPTHQKKSRYKHLKGKKHTMNKRKQIGLNLKKVKKT